MDYQLDREVLALSLITANNGVTFVCVSLCFPLILFLRFASFVLSHLCLLEFFYTIRAEAFRFRGRTSFFRDCFDVLSECLNRN